MIETLQKPVQPIPRFTKASLDRNRETASGLPQTLTTLLICFFIVSVITSAASALEWLPDNKEFFDLTVVDTDVSSEEGYQIEYASYGWVLIRFALPTTIIYDLPRATVRPGWGVVYNRTSNNQLFGYDDYILRVYDPDNNERWSWIGQYNGNGEVPDDRGFRARATGIHWFNEEVARGHWDYDGDNDFRRSYILINQGNVDRYLYQGFQISAVDIRAYETRFNSSPNPIRHLFIGDTVDIEFKQGTFANSHGPDLAKIAGEPDKYGRAKNNHQRFRFELVEPDRGTPKVLHINDVEDANGDQPIQPITSDPSEAVVLELLLTEQPREMTPDGLFTVTNGTVTHIVAKDTVTSGFYDVNGNGTRDSDEGIGRVATGRSAELYPYSVYILPDPGILDPIVVSVNAFQDRVIPSPNTYPGGYQATIPLSEEFIEINSQLPVNTTPPVDIYRPTNTQQEEISSITLLPEKLVIPANGYLVLARGKQGTSIGDDSHAFIEHSPVDPADKKSAAQKLYNIEYEFSLEYPGNDFVNLFRDGGTLQLLHVNIPGNTAGADANVGYPGAADVRYAPGDVLINEVMWGLDRTHASSQYIELYNRTNANISFDRNEWVIAVGSGSDPVYTTVVDVMSNANLSWVVPGQSGATLGTDAATPEVAWEIKDLVSMVRVGLDGRLSTSWAPSERPNANLHGRRVGTPGAPNRPPMRETLPPTGTPVAAANAIVITEIMADTSSDRLPQWIELANVSGRSVILDGWSVSIVNSPFDAVGASQLSLDGVEIGPNQVALIVSGVGRQGMSAIDRARVVNARKKLLSETGFIITLMPPSGEGDMAGNLGQGWDLPDSRQSRHSLIRSETGSGIEAETWGLASVLMRPYIETYYGLRSDVGTPGWHGSGGALPVELSAFVASRDPVTGAVEITWETQSETQNAGFHITRSEHREGTFEAVNASLIPGAGTTSEKQSYRYTDTTAKPNVVYYYRIEDVSLEGDRSVLTHPHRLRGHISASGKTTLLWGDLKSRE